MGNVQGALIFGHINFIVELRAVPLILLFEELPPVDIFNVLLVHYFFLISVFGGLHFDCLDQVKPDILQRNVVQHLDLQSSLNDIRGQIVVSGQRKIK